MDIIHSFSRWPHADRYGVVKFACIRKPIIDAAAASPAPGSAFLPTSKHGRSMDCLEEQFAIEEL